MGPLTERQIWMVAGVPFERGQETPTFGPFAMPDSSVGLSGGSLMAAPRDHTAYMRSRGGLAYKLHVVVTEGCVSGCGRLLVDDAAEPAAGVPARRRCQRRGCKERWPDA